MLSRYSAPQQKKNDVHDISHLNNAEDEECTRQNLSARPLTMVTHAEVYQAKLREQAILNDHSSSDYLDGPPTWFDQAVKDAVGVTIKGYVKDAVKDAIDEKLDNIMKRMEYSESRVLARAANGHLLIGASIHSVMNDDANVPDNFLNTIADLKGLKVEQ